MAPQTPVNTARVEVFKTLVLALFAIALGIAVLFCIIQVGNYNGHAALLQACLDAKSTAEGCPSTPINAGQIAAARNTADTLGSIGWVCTFLLLFVVGSEVMDRLRRS